jgi:hypothetical protein
MGAYARSYCHCHHSNKMVTTCQRFGHKSAFIGSPILVRAGPYTHRMLTATCDTRRLKNMGVIIVYQSIFCWWGCGCVIIAEMVWVHRRSQNATKHNGNIAAFIRLVSASVLGPRSCFIVANSASSGLFILGDRNRHSMAPWRPHDLQSELSLRCDV